MLKSFAGKVQKGLSVFAHRRRGALRYLNEETEGKVVPDDVVEGHFAVLAIKGEETKRFIVELQLLTDPAFLGLLNLAKDEFGFRQKGTLTVPCRPQELKKILDDRR